MSERPSLTKDLDGEAFRSFYYLKEELMGFCRENGLPTAGGKLEIANRIAYFLDTGKRLTASKSVRSGRACKDPVSITEATSIEVNFVCSETHRAFFKAAIGKQFSFNVAFQKWLKANSGKTYAQAIQAYHQILVDKKNHKTTIKKQFEYNTYIRDFFEDNKGLSLTDAIACWKYKRSQQGHNRYEKTDLAALA